MATVPITLVFASRGEYVSAMAAIALLHLPAASTSNRASEFQIVLDSLDQVAHGCNSSTASFSYAVNFRNLRIDVTPLYFSNSSRYSRVRAVLRRCKPMSLRAFLGSTRTQRNGVAERAFRVRCAAVGDHLKIERVPYILNHGRIILGNHVELSGSSDILFSNILCQDPELRIGDHTFIGHGCSFDIAESVVIGDHCRVAAAVRIRDFDGHPLDAELRRAGKPTPPQGIKPIRIGNDVWIGNNAMILKGVTIGDRAVVSALSLVADDVPADALVGGNPARVIKFLNGAKRNDANGTGSSKAVDGVPGRFSAGACAAEKSESRIKRVLSDLTEVSLEEMKLSAWLDYYGIDSLKLLVFREMLEKDLGLRFPDQEWFSFGSIQDIIDFAGSHGRSGAETPRASASGVDRNPVDRPSHLGRRYTRSGMLYTDLEIGLPLTGRNNLAEGPLLQYLGDLRWAH